MSPSFSPKPAMAIYFVCWSSLSPKLIPLSVLTWPCSPISDPYECHCVALAAFDTVCSPREPPFRIMPRDFGLLLSVLAQHRRTMFIRVLLLSLISFGCHRLVVISLMCPLSHMLCKLSVPSRRAIQFIPRVDSFPTSDLITCHVPLIEKGSVLSAPPPTLLTSLIAFFLILLHHCLLL